MIYITGDKHADFKDVYDFCSDNKTSLSRCFNRSR